MNNKKIENITFPLEWPDDEEILEKIVMDVLRTFNYGEYMFIPVGTIKESISLREVTKHISSDKNLGVWADSYSDTYGTPKIKYCYADFYNACGNFPCDVFKCLDNCKLYIPGENELFLYTGEYTPVNNRLLMRESIE